MPVIVDPEAYDLWLDPGINDVRVVADMLRPFDAGRMRCYPVSSRVNYAANDDPECSERVELAGIQSQLF
jgi:putative SOS response-associated peptidase YedK